MTVISPTCATCRAKMINVAWLRQCSVVFPGIMEHVIHVPSHVPREHSVNNVTPCMCIYFWPDHDFRQTNIHSVLLLFSEVVINNVLR